MDSSGGTAGEFAISGPLAAVATVVVVVTCGCGGPWVAGGVWLPGALLGGDKANALTTSGFEKAATISGLERALATSGLLKNVSAEVTTLGVTWGRDCNDGSGGAITGGGGGTAVNWSGDKGPF